MTSGKIGAILQMGGSDSAKLTIKDKMDALNTLATQFASAMNAVQTGGKYIDSSTTPQTLSVNIPGDFFLDSANTTLNITAGNIKVNDALVSDPYQIAAGAVTSGPSETGDGSNALLMTQVRDKQDLIGLGGTTTQGYLTNMVGKLGTQSKNLQDNNDIKDNTLQQITTKRDSLTGVNLDEELTDLVRFQRSYEASAKIMTTLSQTLTTILNMIG